MGRLATMIGGIEVVGALIGLYCIPVLIDLVATPERHLKVDKGGRAVRFREGAIIAWRSRFNLLRSSIIGTLIGIIKVLKQIEDPAAAGAGESGREAVYGVRPEDIRLDPAGVPAQVMQVEPTGADTHVIARVGAHDVVAAFRERHALKPGDAIGLTPAVERVHLFDRATGLRLSA